MPEVVLGPELLAAMAGVILSLAFSYVPGVKTWYKGLSGEWKRLIMAGLLLVTALVLYGLGCAAVVKGVTCSRDGFAQLVWMFLVALVSNQSTYTIAGSQERNWHVYDEEDLPEM